MIGPIGVCSAQQNVPPPGREGACHGCYHCYLIHCEPVLSWQIQRAITGHRRLDLRLRSLEFLNSDKDTIIGTTHNSENMPITIFSLLERNYMCFHTYRIFQAWLHRLASQFQMETTCLNTRLSSHSVKVVWKAKVLVSTFNKEKGLVSMSKLRNSSDLWSGSI